ncbi:MAG: amidohydrolase family protein [Thermofilum sp.]
MLDFHVHLPLHTGPDAVKLAQAALAYIEGEGLEAVVVHPTAPYHSNDLVAKIVDTDPRRIIGFASVVPCPSDAAIRELSRAVEELGLQGLSLHPSQQGFCLKSPHVWQVIRFAGEELGIPVVLHGPPSKTTLRGRLLETPWLNTAEDYALLPFIAPRATLILSDPGSPADLRLFASLASSHVNVYLDTSHSFLQLAGKHGEALSPLREDKLIFGTGYELGGAGALREAVELLRGLYGESASTVLSKNARDLLGLRKPAA